MRKQLGHRAPCALPCARPCVSIGSLMIEPTVIRGSSDAIRVLEDDLHPAAHLAQLVRR